MSARVIKLLKVLGLCFAAALLAAKPSYAQEITAIDFNGDLIGKVIPDGTAISFDNEIIGNVTADSFIVNDKGDLIGGVIPQGVVIGNDNKLLGKVNNDGSVRLPSGKIVGKVLPNGLVVDDSYQVLGAVLYPGLIYNDNGQTIGRLTGDGNYTSLEGQNVGFVSPLGYAYRNNGSGYVLDGKLISSKMVVSAAGKFIGSIAPGGRVTDFDAKVIGVIHGNGFVYDDNNQVIGRAVNTGYAFDNEGRYFGLVTYNGEVLNHGEVVGNLRADGKIIDSKNQVIGFVVDLAATASDLSGKYLGRLMPDGQIARSREAIGSVGPRGKILNARGEIIGQLIQPGPVFDYLSNLTAQALRSGSANSITGSPLGYVKGNLAFDNIGRLLGAVPESVLVVDASNNVLGLSGIGAEFSNNGSRLKISPFGYVYTYDNTLTGRTVPLDAFYNEDGTIQSYIGARGEFQNAPAELNLKLNQFGMAVNDANKIAGQMINPYFAVSDQGAGLGLISETNLLLNANRQVSAKIVPEYKIISSSEKINRTVMPVIGTAGKSMLAVGINGGMLGYADYNGVVHEYSGNIIGTVAGDDVVNTKKAIIGKIAGFDGVVNPECTFLGVIGPKGEVRNSRDVVLGKILTNGQAVSEVGNIFGFSVKGGAVINYDGEIIGAVNSLGNVLTYNQENLGCVSWNGRVYDNNHALIGIRTQVKPVMNFENMMFGRVNVNGEVVNDKSEVVGYTQPDDTVVAANGALQGVVFKYRVAFDNENSFMGRVLENGTVISDKNDVLGMVQYDGTVVADNKPIGYALYDFYIYDENGNAIGYLTREGNVANFSGGRLGKADRGYLIDKNYNLIGRGNRDYFIRDDENAVIGELLLNGEVVNRQGEIIGTVSGSGEIRNEDQELLATARPLQYYNAGRPEAPKPAEWAGTPQSTIKVEPVPTPQPEEGTGSGYGLKAIGIALTPDGNYLGDILFNNDVIDKLGNLLGKKMPDGLVIDDDGNLIGIEEVKGASAEQMFVPAGTFGSGGAYGTGMAPTNLGPGGGFGPGERYDPARSAALAAAQSARRSEITVGKLSTNVDRNSFDGRQPYWEGVSRQISTWRVDMSEMILADKPIPAVLARTIMSSDGADDVPVTAIVERNVYAEEGRNIIIPAGSRVMGTSSGGNGGGTSGGAVRVSITWTRLIRPDGSAFEFSAAKTGDAQGRGGALGYLDEQLLKKYTLPMVTNLLSSGLAYLTATGDDGTSSGESSLESSRQQAANDARQNFLDNMNEMFNQILEDKTNIAAVTYVPAGTRLIIYPKEDLWLRTLDRSKEEALKDLEKPEVFIDDRGSTGAAGKQPSAGGQSASQGGSTSGVVYQDEDVDAKPTQTFIDDSAAAPKKKQPNTGIPPVTTTGATPPPPSTSGGLPPSTSTSRNTDTSAQLF